MEYSLLMDSNRMGQTHVQSIVNALLGHSMTIGTRDSF